MASMRDIKRRKSSIESTQQITKAMKLVATVKLQKAKLKAEQSQTYFDALYHTMLSILAKAPDIDHPYLKSDGKGKKAVIMITSNKGLAGGYNSNIIKLITKNEEFTRDNTVIYAIGKKGKDSMKRYGYTIGKDYSEVIEEPAYQDAVAITKELLAAFEAGEISEIYLAYTFFRNTVSHIPTLRKLLPVDVKDAGVKEEEGATAPMNFEPEDEEALTLIIPKYIASQLYGGLIESIASENGARMQAMDSATNNATEMIDHLSLLYNRARQSSITQELTEIIAGADAIN
ncbi:MAG: ATP synthase F1 subunit gamma [Lachnospiraceae bacterium]|nr:ATP synthase F1 subunit gamma [Lachnospiraceae bacterium]